MRIGLVFPAALCLAVACVIAATAGAVEPLLVPGDGELLRQALAGFTANPARRPDLRLVLGPWGVADGPSLVRHWTSAFAGLPAAASVLDAAYRDAVATDPWARGALAWRFLPAAQAVRDLQPLADAAFDRGDLRGFLALSQPIARGDDPRLVIARALSGGDLSVDPTLALTAPGVPQLLQIRPHTADEAAGLSVTWCVQAEHLLALDPWQRPTWQRAFTGLAEVHSGPGGAVISDRQGVRLVREDGSLTAAVPPDLGDQQVTIAGSAAWFVRGTTVRRIAFSDGATITVTLPEPPLAPPLVRGESSLWLTRHELVLLTANRISARLRHGLPADSSWRLAAQQERIFLLTAQTAYRVPALAQQLAMASPASRVELLVHAGRYAEALALAAAVPATERAARRALLTAYLADGIPVGQREAVLALADDPQDRALILAEQLLAGNPADPRLTAVVHDHPELRFPAQRTQLADEADTWDHVLSGAVLLGTAATMDQRYILDDDGDATIITCTSAGVFRWRQRWPAEPVPSGAPRRSLVQRSAFLVISEGINRLVVLTPSRGEMLGVIDCGQLDAEPAQATVLGCDANGVLRVALLHPAAVNDHLTILASDGSTRTTALPAAARAVIPLADMRLRVEQANGASLEMAAGQ